MSMASTNTAPTVDSHLLVQLLLCIGLPMLILPILVAAIYCLICCAKNRKKSKTDVEQGNLLVKSSDCGSSDSGSDETQFKMTPALATNSVHMPVRPGAVHGRNF